MAGFFADDDETPTCEVCNKPMPTHYEVCVVCHNKVCDNHVAYEHMLRLGIETPVCTECAPHDNQKTNP
jgi:hypothetical protein